MIQITPQMHVLVAVEPVDLRKYAPSIDMRSWSTDALAKSSVERFWTAHNWDYGLARSRVSNLSGGRKRPRRKVGGTKDAMASSFSVGSALR
jgi:hypothetical protein